MKFYSCDYKKWGIIRVRTPIVRAKVEALSEFSERVFLYRLIDPKAKDDGGGGDGNAIAYNVTDRDPTYSIPPSPFPFPSFLPLFPFLFFKTYCHFFTNAQRVFISLFQMFLS